jgi:hypothetical protein
VQPFQQFKQVFHFLCKKRRLHVKLQNSGMICKPEG